MFELSKTEEARVISALIKFSDDKCNVDFSNSDLCILLGNIIKNSFHLHGYLYEINQAGIVTYEEIGEDGFEPIIYCSTSIATHEYLEGLLWQINEDSINLKTRITEILSFDPNGLAKEIEETERKLSEIKTLVSKNDLLKPLERQINSISSHFDSAKVVAGAYEDIFKNIIKPVQEEGRQGVRATVRWAIISILISLVLSWVTSNWKVIYDLFHK